MNDSEVNKKRKFREIDRKKFQRILNKEKLEIGAKIAVRGNGRTSKTINNVIKEEEEVEEKETVDEKLGN